MNLIEQLGGYENTKKYYDSLEDGNPKKTDMAVRMLAYRREHNIFEVGDWVVVAMNDGIPLFEVDCLYRGVGVDLLGVDGEIVSHYSLLDIRHATEYEIKTGKRRNHPLNNKKADGTCGLCGLKAHDEIILK